MTFLTLLLASTIARADSPLPAPRQMMMPENRPMMPKALVIGEVPDCLTLAAEPSVPSALKAGLHEAITRARDWQNLYDQTWTEYGSFEKRCRDSSAAAGGKAPDPAATAELKGLKPSLERNLAALRARAVSLSPPAKPGSPQSTEKSLLDYKKEVSDLQPKFAKKKEATRADEASKCAGALGAQAAAVTSAMDRFEERARAVCALPATSP